MMCMEMYVKIKFSSTFWIYNLKTVFNAVSTFSIYTQNIGIRQNEHIVHPSYALVVAGKLYIKPALEP